MVKYLDKIILSCLLILGFCLCDFSVDSKAETKDFKEVYYDHIEHSNNVMVEEVDGYSIKHSGTLQNVGDFYEMSFDVVNSSQSDVTITKCFVPRNDSYIEYRLTYDDGKIIKTGDVLKSGEVKRIHYQVFYRHLILDETYEFDSSFSLQFNYSF